LGKPEPERIGAIAAVNFVIAKVVYYPVISRASVNPVITTVSRDLIITCETVDDVIFSGAFQSDIVTGAIYMCHSCFPFRDFFLFF